MCTGDYLCQWESVLSTKTSGIFTDTRVVHVFGVLQEEGVPQGLLIRTRCGQTVNNDVINWGDNGSSNTRTNTDFKYILKSKSWLFLFFNILSTQTTTKYSNNV